MKNYWLERKEKKKACEKRWKRIEIKSTCCCDWIMTSPEITSVFDATTATWAPIPCNDFVDLSQGNSQTFHVDVPPGWAEDAFVEKIKAEFSKGGGYVI